IVFHERWRCQNSSLNKTAGRYSSSCPAFVDIKIKKVNRHTKKNDAFLKRPVPLAAVVRLREDHNHNLGCADGLRLLKCSPDTRAKFHAYFQVGKPLFPLKFSRRHYLGCLLVLAPFVGADVRTARTQDGCCWAVLVVTGIMRRTQQLAAASEVVFMDSTSSTDGTQSTTTSTDSYVHAFHLLKSSYPDCFGGAHAPQAFMTDDSSAEKAALRTTWPESTQLLCHFHVGQAEWRWL
ncbi:unnamed protein product, partial [Ixodes persulcatus]